MTLDTQQQNLLLPMLPRGPSLPDGQLQHVQVGSVVNFRAGVYVNRDTDATFQIQGDTAGVFRILRVETDDVEFIDDPDVPRKKIAVLVPALKVDGPGPIHITSGEAVIVDVQFSCPADPASPLFKANLVGAGTMLISASVNLGDLFGHTLTSPTDMAPGETANFGFELFSSIAHPVTVALKYDPLFDPESHFSAPTSAPVTVPASGGSARLTVPVTCTLGTPEGDHVIGFSFLLPDGAAVGTGITTPITVVGGSVGASLDHFGSGMNVNPGGIAPFNVTLWVARGGGTDVSFATNTAGFAFSGPPIRVDPGQNVHGTLWLEAGSEVPISDTLQDVNVTMLSYSNRVTHPFNVKVATVPALRGENFVIFRIYWGPKWAAGSPFSWQAMEKAIFTAVRSPYMKGLVEYGVVSVDDVALSNGPPPPNLLPSTALEPTFPATNDFDENDITALITGLIDSRRLPAPDTILGKPYYYVMPQQGSFYRPDRTGILGRHSEFSYRGSNALYAWGYQGATVDGTTPILGHELVEALCAKAAAMEIGDPCQLLSGRSGGILLQPYLSKLSGLCVLPGMTNNSDVAATNPVPGKTGA